MDINLLYNSMFPYEGTNFDISQQDVSYNNGVSYNKENKTSIKQHVTSAITKYFNTVYYEEILGEFTHLIQPNTRPISYQYCENFIGVSNFIFYIINAPMICDGLLKVFQERNTTAYGKNRNRMQAIVLLLDTRFQNIWVLNKRCHVFNSICSGGGGGKFDEIGSADLYTQNEILKSIVKFKDLKLKLELEPGNPPTSTPCEILSNEINKIFPTLTPDEVVKIQNATDIIISEIIRILQYIKGQTESMLNWSLIDFSVLMEVLSPFFIYYFKGGNSLHKIFEKYNAQCTGEDENFKIDITNVVPYGSDFDTNLLISPYLDNVIYDLISDIVEISIPQISQFIQFPHDMLSKFMRPPKEFNNKIIELLVGNKDSFEKKYMNILFNSYKITSKYMFKDKYEKKERTTWKEEQEKDKHFITLKAETIQSFPVSTVYQAPDGNKFWYYSFSKIDPTTLSRRYINPTENNNGYLQLNINKSIEGFNLFRYFLKFQFNKYDQNSNPTARLIDLKKYFNNEVLDISVIKNKYVKKGQKYYAESVELWNNAIDIFKNFTVADINILKRLNEKYNDLLKNSPELFSLSHEGKKIYGFPYFCNGVRLQYEDLLNTIKDNVRENKTEKLEKRIKRFKAISQVAFFDLSKESNKYINEYFLNLELLQINIGYNDIYKNIEEAAEIRGYLPLYKFMNELFLQFRNSYFRKVFFDSKFFAISEELFEEIFSKELLSITKLEFSNARVKTFEGLCVTIMSHFCMFCKKFWVLGFDIRNQKIRKVEPPFTFTTGGKQYQANQIIDLVPINQIIDYYKKYVYADGKVDIYTNNNFNIMFLLHCVFVNENINENINRYKITFESYISSLFSELDKSKIISNIFRIFYNVNKLYINSLYLRPNTEFKLPATTNPINKDEYLTQLFSRPAGPILPLYNPVISNISADVVFQMLKNRVNFLVSMYTIFCVKKLYIGGTNLLNWWNWDLKILNVCHEILNCTNIIIGLFGIGYVERDYHYMTKQLVKTIENNQDPVIFFQKSLEIYPYGKGNVANLFRIWHYDIYTKDSESVFTRRSTMPSELIIINPFYPFSKEGFTFILADYDNALEYSPTLNDGYQDINYTFSLAGPVIVNSNETLFLKFHTQMKLLFGPTATIFSRFEEVVPTASAFELGLDIEQVHETPSVAPGAAYAAAPAAGAAGAAAAPLKTNETKKFNNSNKKRLDDLYYKQMRDGRLSYTELQELWHLQAAQRNAGSAAPAAAPAAAAKKETIGQGLSRLYHLRENVGLTAEQEWELRELERQRDLEAQRIRVRLQGLYGGATHTMRRKRWTVAKRPTAAFSKKHTKKRTIKTATRKKVRALRRLTRKQRTN